MSLYCNIYRAMLFLFLVVNCSSVSAQKENSIWLFGTNNGIDFNSGAPVAITNPNFSSFDYLGVATVSDWQGSLLFYSDGNIVYNRQHNQMPNGNGLFGNLYASQAVISVRAMHDTSLHYLFTLDNGGGSNPMAYSIVDMKANGGLGDVTTKNIPLLSDPTEQLCAIKHCNGRDVWVVSHQWLSDAYYAYLVTPEGVSTTPVVSHSGRQVNTGPWGWDNKIGCMKGSPDGKKIAAAYRYSGVDVSDFDNSTGMVSNSIALPVRDVFLSSTFGVEFSPNSRFLYTTYLNISNSIIYQFDVLAGSPMAIIASKSNIAEQDFFGYVSGLQTGPDGKIYVANYGWTQRVSIINNPDIQGAGCNFVWEGLQLLGVSSSHCFPSYIKTTFDPEPIINTSVACPLQKINFEYENKPDYVQSVKWLFGDPASGIADTAYDLNPVHEFTDEGTYHVRLVRFFGCETDTIKKDITVQKLIVDIGNDTSVCSNTGYSLVSSTSANVDYLWQDGSMNNDLLANFSGLYWLQVTDRTTGCTASDTILLDILDIPVFTLGPDQATCEKEIRFDITVPSASSYLWSNGNNQKNISFSSPGIYWLHVNNGKCFYRDTIALTFNSLSVNIGPDTIICENEILILDAGNQGGLEYIWQDGSSNRTLLANSSGLYWLQATDPVTTCSTRDSMMLDVLAMPVFTLGPDQATCEPEIRFDISAPSTSYLWSTGSNERSIPIATSGLYWLQINNGKCFYRDSVELTFNALSINIGADTTVCEDETLILDAGNQGLDYTWQDGSKSNSFTVKTQGLYIVTASNGTCTGKDSVQINYNKKPVFNLGEDKMFCNGDVVILGSQLDNIYAYVWEDGSTSVKRTVTGPGTFQLTGSNECGSFTDEVVVKPGGCKLAVPNAFTPDGDGKNDVFRISKTYGLSSFAMQVFNRWGQKIFESRDQSQGWNGTLAGRNCDAGNYAYVIQYRTDDGTPVILKGTVMLIR